MINGRQGHSRGRVTDGRYQIGDCKLYRERGA